ncbi:hypothetical protein LTR27_000690 [Elasticomyces elasticus]|nr:hypothetical protein LTR27_000690 [Elasticomyces elasticus]
MERIKTTPPVIDRPPVTQTNTSSTVFEVSELLEMIILWLPMRDMQRARAVCKTWKDGIDASIRIKRALFLVDGIAGDRAYDITVWSTDSAAAAVPISCERYCAHPLFGGRDDEFGIARMHDVVKHGNRSLRDVFLTQPPTMVAVSVLIVHGPENRGMSIELEAGETFGSLYGKLADIAYSYPMVEWSKDEAVVNWNCKDYRKSTRGGP